MAQRGTESNMSDSIDEFFEPVIGEGLEEALDDDAPLTTGKNRLAELRRRAEQRLEEKRLQEELDYLDLDWED